MLLELQRGILYGPVNSRRLGKSLGINLSPTNDKFCSFNCVYCHFGWTKRQSLDFTSCLYELPRADDVVAAVDDALQSNLDFAYLTFSGNGEPTLHPQFPDMVQEIVALRDRYRPQVKVALLSNSTGLAYAPVRDVIPRIDRPMFKLDAGREKTFRAINRPAEGIAFQDIIDSLAALDGVYLQTVMIDGTPSNVATDELTAYFTLLNRIHPREVHIYSIDRPVPDQDIRLVSPERLEEIAARGRQETGVNMRAFYPRHAM